MAVALRHVDSRCIRYATTCCTCHVLSPSGDPPLGPAPLTEAKSGHLAEGSSHSHTAPRAVGPGRPRGRVRHLPPTRQDTHHLASPQGSLSVPCGPGTCVEAEAPLTSQRLPGGWGGPGQRGVRSSDRRTRPQLEGPARGGRTHLWRAHLPCLAWPLSRLSPWAPPRPPPCPARATIASGAAAACPTRAPRAHRKRSGTKANPSISRTVRRQAALSRVRVHWGFRTGDWGATGTSGKFVKNKYKHV